jgi:hypothetical protein
MNRRQERRRAVGLKLQEFSKQNNMNSAFLDYYLCPEEFARFGVAGELGKTPGFFRLGKKITCFGHSAAPRGYKPNSDPPDVLPLLHARGNEIMLPFDTDEILENLRKERYVGAAEGSSPLRKLARKAYYAARPFLSVKVRKHVQRFHLRERKQIEFPSWPIDKTVDNLCAELMSFSVRANENQRVPFVWFWPNDYQGCVLMTHDVEHEEGKAFCGELMDMDERYGIRSSFQVIPEERYALSNDFLDGIRARDFELNVHDLNHDGHLFESQQLFLERAGKINEYAKKWSAEGFRAGGMYRNAEWSEALQFTYDMSFPSAAHLEPQRGGCCSVLPYFVGGLVELPLTTTQDYSLFHILDEYSIDLWKEEMDFIASSNGLASFIVHPDYVIESRARRVYEDLLQYLSELCRQAKLWQPLPRDVARWWRDRNGMRIVPWEGSWKVVGPGAERARLAYAQIQNGRLIYHVVNSSCREAVK